MSSVFVLFICLLYVFVMKILVLITFYTCCFVSTVYGGGFAQLIIGSDTLRMYPCPVEQDSVLEWQIQKRLVEDTSSVEYWLGFLCSFGAMALWTWFPIRNSQWLLKHPNVSPLAWTTAQGASMLPATLLCYVAVNFETFLHGGAVLGQTPVKFVLLMVAAGLICGWAGMALWNMMSARLPVALSGQMIVFETIFSVIYSLIYKQQAPKWTLVVGVFLLLGGVLLSLKVFRDSGRKVSQPN